MVCTDEIFCILPDQTLYSIAEFKELNLVREMLVPSELAFFQRSLVR